MAFPTAFRDPWVIAQLAWMAAVAAGAPLASRLVPGRAAPWALVTGLLLCGVGGAVLVRAAADLGRGNLTPAVRPRREGTLVTAGLYGLVRHPMYFAVLVVLTGYALLFRNLAVSAAVLGVSYAFFAAKAAREEVHLVARFPAYAEYRRRVPKLVPFPLPRG